MASFSSKGLAQKIASAEPYEPSPKSGLSNEQVELRNKQGLVNISRVKPYKSHGRIVFENLVTLPNFLLLVVIGLLALARDSWLGYLFLLPFVAIIVLGIVQGERLRKVKMGLVKKKGDCVVIRERRETSIPYEEVVLSDILLLEAGKEVPTDCVILEGEVEANEAIVTGDVEHINKKLGDPLYAGSRIAVGKCYARVSSLNGANYGDKVHEEAEGLFASQKAVFGQIRRIALFSCAMALALIAIQLCSYGFWNGVDVPFAEAMNASNPYGRAFVLSSAGIIGSIVPFAMFLLCSLTLTNYSLVLGKKNFLIQGKKALERLSIADVVCFDKTGTLTTGEMSVQDVLVAKGRHKAEVGYALATLLHFTKDKNQTALALKDRFGDHSMEEASDVCPYSSKRKFSYVTLSSGTTYALGAYEFLPVKKDETIERKIAENCAKGLRCLVLAISEKPAKMKVLPKNMEIAAVISLSDHLRNETNATVDWLQKHNISVRIITGDDPLLAATMASQVGVDGARTYVSLEGKDEEATRFVARDYRVFGRATPEQKAWIVDELKKQSHKVAMVGDGVNDIMALKCADVSLAMGEGAEADYRNADIVNTQGDFTYLPELIDYARSYLNGIGRISALHLMQACFGAVLGFALAIVSFFGKSQNGMPLLFPFTTKDLALLESFLVVLPSLFIAFKKKQEKGLLFGLALSQALVFGLVIGLGFLVFVFGCFAPGLVSVDQDQALSAAKGIYLLYYLVLSAFFLGVAFYKFDKIHLLFYIGFILLSVLALILPSFIGEAYASWSYPTYAFFFVLLAIGLVLIVAARYYQIRKIKMLKEARK